MKDRLEAALYAVVPQLPLGPLLKLVLHGEHPVHRQMHAQFAGTLNSLCCLMLRANSQLLAVQGLAPFGDDLAVLTAAPQGATGPAASQGTADAGQHLSSPTAPQPSLEVRASPLAQAGSRQVMFEGLLDLVSRGSIV